MNDLLPSDHLDRAIEYILDQIVCVTYIIKPIIKNKTSNTVILEGNLVRDLEAKLTSKGTPVCRFALATNRYYKSEGVRQEDVSFFDVEVWSKVAESCEKHLKKGRGVRVVGRLKQDRWTDDQGQPHYRVKVVGEHVELKSQSTVSVGPGEPGDEAAAESEEAMESLEEEVKV